MSVIQLTTKQCDRCLEDFETDPRFDGAWNIYCGDCVESIELDLELLRNGGE